MKDILMIVHTMGTLLETDNDRFTYLAKLLIEVGSNVEIVTSDFEHHKKNYRDVNIVQKHPFKVTFLHENPYKKNISIKRVIGHISFAMRLKSYLEKRKNPDVIYCAIPPTVSASIAARYAEKNKIRFVIDIQDLWPESFEMVLGNNILSKICLHPIAFFANRAYQQADAFIAVSNTYLKCGMKINKKAKCFKSVYLGTDGRIINQIVHSNLPKVKNDNVFSIAYIGNFGKSYDFLHLFQALALLKEKGIKNIRMHMIGDGDERYVVEKLIKEYYPNTIITGYLPYHEMIRYLVQCDIAVNPIIKGTYSSVVNKVADYAATGKPVINTQDNLEYQRLVETYNVGFNALPENTEDIANKILKLYENQKLREKMEKNNQKLFKSHFDRSCTYQEIVNALIGENNV